MGFYERFLYDINETIEKYPNFSVDMIASVFCGKKIRKMRDRYNREVLVGLLKKSTGINKEQYLSEDETEESNKRLEKFYRDVVPKLAHYCKLSALGVDPILEEDYGNYSLNQTVAIMMQPDTTPDADRFNRRIANSWNYGTDEDRAGILREFLDEVERIDPAKWAEKDTVYIMDHFAEYNREMYMVKSAKLVFEEAVKLGYMKEDPARLAHYDELYLRAEIDNRRTDFAVNNRIMPLFSVFHPSGLEKFYNPDRSEDKVDKLERALDKEKQDESIALQEYYKVSGIRKKFEEFTRKCTDNHISVPSTLQEYNERYAEDFKDFDPDLSEACFEVLSTQKRKKCAPWETEKYKKGQKLSETYSEEDMEKYYSYQILDIFEASDHSAMSTYENFLSSHEMEVSDERYGRRYKDTLESVKAYLGYRDNEQLPFVLGGGHNGELITRSGEFEKLSNGDEGECLYVKNKNGQIMSFALDFSELNGLSRGENAIRTATEEEILSLQKKQGAALRRKLAGILGENNDLEDVGSGSFELRTTLDSMLGTAAGNDKDLNDLCSDLAERASGLRDELMNKSRSVRLSDKEGKALATCEKLIDLGNNSYIGVPDSNSETASRMKEEANVSAPSREQVLLKMIRACDTLNATCSGMRSDSEEFKFLHESAKTLRENLRYAEKNDIKMDTGSLRAEYSRVFTAAKKYMEHRKDMPTKNGRTQTRISLAKDILAMGETLECKELTASELVAHSINDRLIAKYSQNLKNNPNSEKEARYIKKCLSDRREADSVIRNNEFFCKTANGMTKEKLLKCAYSEDGRSSFIEKITAIRKKHEEAERKKAAENPNNVHYIKDTGLYKKIMNDVQYSLRCTEKMNLHRALPGDIKSYFFDKMLLNTLKKFGTETVNSDAELEQKLSTLRKMKENDEDIKVLIRNTDTFKTMMRELVAEEIRKYGEHSELANMDFYVTQANKYFKPLEEEMQRKYGANASNLGNAADERNTVNTNRNAEKKGVGKALQ